MSPLEQAVQHYQRAIDVRVKIEQALYEGMATRTELERVLQLEQRAKREWHLALAGMVEETRRV